MVRLSLVFAFCISIYLVNGQTVEVRTSLDTVLLGNTVEVSYTAHNLSCDLSPDLSSLPIYAGPRTSSSVSIINGRRSSQETLTFVMIPQESGIIHLPLVSCDSVSVDPRSIVVLDNPDGIEQSSKPSNGYMQQPRTIPRMPKQPRRRLRKI